MVASTDVSEKPAASTFLVKLLYLPAMGKKRCDNHVTINGNFISVSFNVLATSIHTAGERGSELFTD
jgi:hypothetical protein